MYDDESYNTKNESYDLTEKYAWVDERLRIMYEEPDKMQINNLKNYKIQQKINKKQPQVSLFMSGKYNDEIINETENFMEINYCGQTSGRRDHLIAPNALLFGKNNKKYKLLGKVISVECIDVDVENNNKLYKLYIQKEKNVQKLFRIKNDICDYFGWARLNDYERTNGIIQHR